MYVRADNMSQAFDCALMRTNARNPQWRLPTQLLCNLTPPSVEGYAGGDALAEFIFSGRFFQRIAVN